MKVFRWLSQPMPALITSLVVLVLVIASAVYAWTDHFQEATYFMSVAIFLSLESHRG